MQQMQQQQGLEQGNQKPNLNWISILDWLRKYEPTLLMIIDEQ